MILLRPHEVPRIGELLRESGNLSHAQIEHAVEEQKRTGEKFGECLVNLGYVSQHDLRHALWRQFRLRAVAVTLAASMAVAVPAAALAGTTATLRLIGYVRPSAALQVEKGEMIVPLGDDAGTEIEIIEKASGTGYEVELHSQSAEKSGTPSFRSEKSDASISYKVKYGGSEVKFFDGKARLSDEAASTSAGGVSKVLKISPEGLNVEASGPQLTDSLTLTIKAK